MKKNFFGAIIDLLAFFSPIWLALVIYSGLGFLGDNLFEAGAGKQVEGYYAVSGVLFLMLVIGFLIRTVSFIYRISNESASDVFIFLVFYVPIMALLSFLSMLMAGAGHTHKKEAIAPHIQPSMQQNKSN